MHENPVERGLVLEPGQWIWSSFRDYAYDEPGRVKLNQWPAAKLKRIAWRDRLNYPALPKSARAGHPRVLWWTHNACRRPGHPAGAPRRHVVDPPRMPDAGP